MSFLHDIWNPWHGCVKCSEGCQNCYMYFLDRMRDQNGAEIYKTKSGFSYPLQKDRTGHYKMPCNLAVLDMNAADSIPERFSEVTDWYIGGHSLGGAMAASYAAKHTDELDGLVLLAAYSTADLTDSGLRVYAAYGSEDGVLNREKYEADRVNLPQDTTETVIDGGCHAGFGSYGA